MKYFECSKPGNYGVFVRSALLGESVTAPTKDVQLVVNKLQDKLRAVRREVDENRAVIDRLEVELRQAREDADKFESSMEEAAVESEYLKEHNASVVAKLKELQEKYDHLVADHAILNEEMQIDKELQEAVNSQHLNSMSLEDIEIIVQNNKKLEFTVSSLRKVTEEKESSLKKVNDELSLKSKDFADLKESYDLLLAKLEVAEQTVIQLQEHIESAADLDQIIEHLTAETEQLQLKVLELNQTVDELSELHELDKSLEAGHLKLQNELQLKIEELRKEVKSEKSHISDVVATNSRLEKELLLLKTIPLLRTQKHDESQVTELKEELKRAEKLNSANLVSLKVAEAQYRSSVGMNLSLISASDFFETFQVLFLAKDSLASCLALISVLDGYRMTHSRAKLSYELRHLAAALQHVVWILEWHYQTDASRLDFLIKALESLGSAFSRLRIDVNEGNLEGASSLFVFAFMDETTSGLEQLANDEYLNTVLLLYKLELEALLAREVYQFLESHLKVECLERNQVLELTSLMDGVAARTCELKKEIIAENKELEHFSFNMVGIEVAAQIELLKELDFLTSSVSDNDEQFDVAKWIRESGIETENWLKNGHDCLASLNQQIVFLCERKQDIYKKATNFVEASGENIRDELSNLTAQLVVKDQKIQDLQFNIQLLERNMKSSMLGKEAEKRELEQSLEDLRKEYTDLQHQFNGLLLANKDLESQVHSLLNVTNLSSLHQIPIFEELKAKRKYTTEMALLEEITVLRQMVVPKFSTDSYYLDVGDWLDQLLESLKPNYVEKGSVTFLKEALVSRARSKQLLDNILTSKKRALGINYMRSSWTSF